MSRMCFLDLFKAGLAPAIFLGEITKLIGGDIIYKDEMVCKAKAAQILSFLGWESWKIANALSVDEGKVEKLIKVNVKFK